MSIDFMVSRSKRVRHLLLLIFTFGMIGRTQAQTPPPNDDYTNRIQLVGTDITFSGTTVGASVEQSEWEPWVFLGSMPYPTVWWTWTPTISGQVSVDLGDYSDARIRGRDAFIGVWVNINPEFYLPDFPNNEDNNLYGRRLDLPGHTQFNFYAEAGTNYDIQVCTAPYGTFTFHLVQTNTPLILAPPRDRAVAVGDSTFFGVMPGGLAPFRYQWRFNGTNLVGQTNAIVSVENVNPSMAGSYSVVVSNDFGSVESSAAVLIVRTNFIAPGLSVIGLNADSTVTFNLTGEPLTYYRIQSSSNLIDWVDELSFPKGQHYEGVTSVVLNKGQTTALTVPFSQQNKFFRAVLYQPPFTGTNGTFAQTQLCINNLRRLRFAKEIWASYRLFYPDSTWWAGQEGIDTPRIDEIEAGGFSTAPHCEDFDCFNRSYTFNEIFDFPVCEIDGKDHVLEDPADEY